MVIAKFSRVHDWIGRPGNGWTTPEVAARFEAGVRGEHYLEYLPFAPGMAAHPAGQELIELLTKTQLEGGSVLDFGCGNAVLKELLSSSTQTADWTYIGTDINAESVENCRRRHPDSRFEVVTEGNASPFEDGVADLVLAAGVLESTEDPSALLAEMARLSRKWVALCRLGVHPTLGGAIYAQRVEHKWGIEEHCFHVFGRPGLKQMISQAGLEIEWEALSDASGEWLPPDDPNPLHHCAFLLRKL